MTLLERLFGTGKDLDVLQMATRAFVMFFITLGLIRLAGMRSFGRKSSFDFVIVIMLGAVLSRAITGASAFWPTVAAATMLVAVHRVIAMLTARSPALERAIKGEPHVLYRDGAIDWHAMRRAGISIADLDEAARARARREHYTDVDEITMESSGELTVLSASRARRSRPGRGAS